MQDGSRIDENDENGENGEKTKNEVGGKGALQHSFLSCVLRTEQAAARLLLWGGCAHTGLRAISTKTRRKNTPRGRYRDDGNGA